MSKFNIEGNIEINGSKHTVQYEPSAMTGGGTLFLRLSGNNHNVPIYYNEISEVIQMLVQGKKVISTLERPGLIDPDETGN